MSIFTLVAVSLTLGFVSLGLLAYSRQRINKRRPAAINQELEVRNETDAAADLAYVNDFICIMLRDGTCRSGIMMDPPKQTPGIPTPCETLPSESKLDDGLTELQQRAHPGEHPK